MTAERTKRDAELIAQCRGAYPFGEESAGPWSCDCGATVPEDCELYNAAGQTKQETSSTDKAEQEFRACGAESVEVEPDINERIGRLVSLSPLHHSTSCPGCERCLSEPMDKRQSWERNARTGGRDSANDLFGKGY